MENRQWPQQAKNKIGLCACRIRSKTVQGVPKDLNDIDEMSRTVSITDEIVFCPLHSVADEMLEAMKAAEARLRSVNTYLADTLLETIAKAEGK